MKVWDSVLYEAPSRAHYNRVVMGVEHELHQLRQQNRWSVWSRNIATGSVLSSVLVVVMGLMSWSLRKKVVSPLEFKITDQESFGFLSEMELFEDWDLIENLDFLENWDGYVEGSEDHQEKDS